MPTVQGDTCRCSGDGCGCAISILIAPQMEATESFTDCCGHEIEWVEEQ